MHFIIWPLFWLIVLCGSLKAQSQIRFRNEIRDAPVPIQSSEYALRRDAMLKCLGERSAMILCSYSFNDPSAYQPELLMTSSLYYLTGHDAPSQILILVPSGLKIHGQDVTQLLFIDSSRAIYTSGTALPATSCYTIFPLDELKNIVDSITSKMEAVYYTGPIEGTPPPALINIHYQSQSYTEHIQLSRSNSSCDIIPASNLIAQIRSIKSANELDLVRHAALISVLSHRENIRYARYAEYNDYEHNLKAILEYNIRRYGGSTAYPSIVCSGVSADRNPLNPLSSNLIRWSDLIIIGAGARFQGYAVRASRTVPASGRFTSMQFIIHDLALRAQDSAVRYCKPGATLGLVRSKALATVSQTLLNLEIIQREDEIFNYYNPNIVTIADASPSSNSNDTTQLCPGMVISIALGIYIDENSSCPKKWRNIGVRIEDTFEITESATINLTADLERSHQEIENLMSGRP